MISNKCRRQDINIWYLDFGIIWYIECPWSHFLVPVIKLSAFYTSTIFSITLCCKEYMFIRHMTLKSFSWFHERLFYCRRNQNLTISVCHHIDLGIFFIRLKKAFLDFFFNLLEFLKCIGYIPLCRFHWLYLKSGTHGPLSHQWQETSNVPNVVVWVSVIWYFYLQ